MSPLWHALFWLVLPAYMWLSLWAYAQWRAGR